MVDARFFFKCVFLLCYKASDSIGEVSRRAGMRAYQLGRESELGSGVRLGRQGSRHRAQGRKGRGAGALRAECESGRRAPQRPARSRSSRFL